MSRAWYKALPEGMALTVVLLFLSWMSLLWALNVGLSSADDGLFALVAKSLAIGQGYGYPKSYDTLSLFDPYIGVGPAFILPGAAFIALTGPQDWVGYVSYLIFFGQLCAMFVLLYPRWGFSSSAAFMFVSLSLLITISLGGWYFGVFVGEVPAAGFVLLGAVILSSSRKQSSDFMAGLIFGAAFLSKNIVLFSVAGIMLCWFYYLIIGYGWRHGLVRVCFVALGIAAPLLLYEMAKISTIGWVDYINLWQRTGFEIYSMAVAKDQQFLHRWENFRSILSSVYFPDTRILILAAGLAFLTLSSYGRRGGEDFILAAMLCWGGGGFFFYILLFSTLLDRYFWIGFPLVAFGEGAFVLSATQVFRRFLMIVVAFMTVLVSNEKLQGLMEWSQASHLSDERTKVIEILNNDSKKAIAGRSWHSFYDIIYLMDTNREWYCEIDLKKHEGMLFYAVLNEAFGDKEKFFQAVNSSCNKAFSGSRYSVFECGQAFWKSYSG